MPNDRSLDNFDSPDPETSSSPSPSRSLHKGGSLWFLVVALALVLLLLCVCGGATTFGAFRRFASSDVRATMAASIQGTLVPSSGPTITAAMATLSAWGQEMNSTPTQGPDGIWPTPTVSSTLSPDDGYVVDDNGLDLDVRLKYPPPQKGQPFAFTIEIHNLGSAPVKICAVNFRGDLSSILEYRALVSPPGVNYWVEGKAYQQGAVFDDCIVIAPGKTRSAVFRMKSLVSTATWKGEVGLCEKAPTEESVEALEHCIYVPASVVVP